MRKWSLVGLLSAMLVTAFVGCSNQTPQSSAPKPDPNQGQGRARPGDDKAKGKSDAPKGAMKPVAD